MREAKIRIPLRALNEPAGFMGLQVWDICALGYIFVLSNVLLKPLGLELLSFGVAAGVGYALSIIRLNYRSKIIRDSVKHFSRLRSVYAPNRR
jgi:hypothetical protein